jgi:nucleoside-diphosphate-sugar epimerase
MTGANGFIGSGLVSMLLAEGDVQLRLALRANTVMPGNSTRLDQIAVGNIDSDTQWDAALEDVQVVVHLAARAHRLRDESKDPLQAFRDTNFHGTQRLARAAAKRGVKRFIYVSSIGVNGLNTEIKKPFSESDEPHPHNAYAISKWEAEQALIKISQASGMEFVIIRPPLVYGRDAPGNFAQLLKIVASGIPLPLASVHNLRSLIGLDNLLDFINICCIHPNAANQTFVVADGHDLSTPALILGIAHGMHKKARMFPVPSWALTIAATLTGQRRAMQTLCGSLQVDTSKARKLLGWKPPVSVDECLRRATAQWRT